MEQKFGNILNKDINELDNMYKELVTTKLNYEEKNLLQADVKDGATGNRYYMADSLTKIRTIRVLQNLGLSLDDIQAYYDGTTDMQPMIERLEKLRDELNLNIEKLKQRVKSDNDFELHTVTIPEQTIYRRTMHADTVDQRKEHLRDIYYPFCYAKIWLRHQQTHVFYRISVR